MKTLAITRHVEIGTGDKRLDLVIVCDEDGRPVSVRIDDDMPGEGAQFSAEEIERVAEVLQRMAYRQVCPDHGYSRHEKHKCAECEAENAPPKEALS